MKFLYFLRYIFKHSELYQFKVYNITTHIRQDNKIISYMKVAKNHKQSSIQIKNPDQAKIKSLLLSKLQQQDNPQQIVEDLQDDIAWNLQRMQSQLQRQAQRKNKIKKVQTMNLKQRDQLKQKLELKMLKTIQKRQKQLKNKLQNKIRFRKNQEQLIADRRKSLKDADMKERLQKFKMYQSVNQKQTILEKPSKVQNKSTQNINRYSSEEHIRRSKQLQEYDYYKIMELLNKKKVFQKTQKIIKRQTFVDKSQYIMKIRELQANTKLNMLAQDLVSIQQARKKKQKQIKTKVQKARKQQDLQKELRSYRIQNLKEETIKKMIQLKQKQKKKNQQFITHKNSSSDLEGFEKRHNSSKALHRSDKFDRTLSSFRVKVDTLHNLTSDLSKKRDINYKLRKEIKQYVKMRKKQLLNIMN